MRPIFKLGDAGDSSDYSLSSSDIAFLDSDAGYGDTVSITPGSLSSSDVAVLNSNVGYGDTIQITAGSLSSSDVAAIFGGSNYGDGTPTATTVSTTSAAGTSAFDTFLKTLPAGVAALSNYRKTTLPGGGAVYSLINPATGQPYANTTTVGAGLAAMFQSNPMLLLGVAAVALLLLSGPKKRPEPA